MVTPLRDGMNLWRKITARVDNKGVLIYELAGASRATPILNSKSLDIRGLSESIYRPSICQRGTTRA